MAFEYKQIGKGFPLRKYLLGTAIVLFLLILGFVLVALYYPYSDGFRVGTVQKFSNKGLVFKTYEGTLNMGVVNFSSPTSSATAEERTNSAVWNFSVSSSDKDAIKEIEDAMTNGQRVKVHYKQMLYQLDWRGETTYFVYKVEPIK